MNLNHESYFAQSQQQRNIYNIATQLIVTFENIHEIENTIERKIFDAYTLPIRLISINNNESIEESVILYELATTYRVIR